MLLFETWRGFSPDVIELVAAEEGAEVEADAQAERRNTQLRRSGRTHLALSLGARSLARHLVRVATSVRSTSAGGAPWGAVSAVVVW